MAKFVVRAAVAALLLAVPVVYGVQTLVVHAAQRSEGETLYQQGHYAEAMQWWTEHAAQGDIESARRLGVEYMDGKPWVTQRDYEKARKYHLQAAMGGEPRSMMDLGTIYESAMGVPENMSEAARWYGWGAKYGFSPAQNNFATLLESGEGVAKDEVEAYKYYILVALDQAKTLGGPKPDLDHPPAESAMAELGKRLTPAQRAEGRSRAAKFVALTGPLPASENH